MECTQIATLHQPQNDVFAVCQQQINDNAVQGKFLQNNGAIDLQVGTGPIWLGRVLCSCLCGGRPVFKEYRVYHKHHA